MLRDARISSYQETTKGCLRVHLRTSIGNQVIIPALRHFFERYPDVTMNITLTDARADLVAQRVDVAVWLGNLEDSSFIARRLSPGRPIMCASPAYLERYGCPRIPEDLKEHNCLLYRTRNDDAIWRFTTGKKTIEVPVSGAVQTDSGAALLTAALSGLGLAILEESIAVDALLGGKLLQILTDYEITSNEFDTAIYAVYPASRISPKVRAFIDFLVALFRNAKSEAGLPRALAAPEPLHNLGDRRAKRKRRTRQTKARPRGTT